MFLGKVYGRDSYSLQRHCIDHCQLESCPHRGEATVELNRVIPPPDYSHLIRNGGPSETVDVRQQGIGPQQLDSGEAPVPSGQASSKVVPRISNKDRGRSKGLLVNKRTSGRGSRRAQGSGHVGTKYRLSSRTIIGTGSKMVLVIEACNEEKDILEEEFDSVKNGIVIMESRLQTERTRIDTEISGVDTMARSQEAMLHQLRSGIHVLQSQDNQIVQEATGLFGGLTAELEAQSKRIPDNTLQGLTQKCSIQTVQKGLSLLSK